MTAKTLAPVHRVRVLRRDAAQAQLAAARREADQAQAHCVQAQAAVTQCERWLAELNDALFDERARASRAALLASCRALLQHRRETLSQRQAALRTALERCERARGELLQRQRSVLRIEQWEQLQQQAQARAALLREGLQDEEWLRARS